MVGKTDIPDHSTLFFLLNPVPDPDLHEFLPGPAVVEHMHQIIIDIISLKPLQLLLKLLFCAGSRPDQIMRQFRCQIDLFPAVIFCKDLSDGLLVSRINISCIKIIDTVRNPIHQLLFRLLQIDGRSVFGKTHAAVPED